MKRILLPTDFSDNSWNAITYALNLFKNEECNFILLNTYTPIIYDWEYLQTSNAQLSVTDAMKENSERGLEEVLRKVKSQFNNPKHIFTTISSFNILTLEIAELHRGNAIDMVIMGTKGASGIEKVLLGSNTIHVLNRAKCPVIAVPTNFHFEKPHEILFPTDFELDYKVEHLQFLLDIAISNGARLNILHVNYGQELTEVQKEFRKKLEGFIKNATYLFHDLSNKNVPEAITDFQRKARVNLLAMINHKHFFFENLFFSPIINHIGFKLEVPFLVIPAKFD
ncbi:universal stress protein [Aegicerativicinus sediminis]|uniref:universal stress protein n=1 Tax=Aegicerativicinus sediminis TaxID=2893202 RepID=UPI001E2A5AD1|nr:universal stress protein [Aegicerativicinus sediminis]